LADTRGAFAFHGLPPGIYRARAYRSGCGWTESDVTLEAGRTLEWSGVLPDRNANRIRNGDLAMHWLGETWPDHWYRSELGWEGEIIPLVEGRQYRLKVEFKDETPGDVLVRWSRRVEMELPRRSPLPRIESRPVTRANPVLEFEGTSTMGLVQVTIRSGEHGSPRDVCARIDLRAVE
jgi:hypothetical protein